MPHNSSSLCHRRPLVVQAVAAADLTKLAQGDITCCRSKMGSVLAILCTTAAIL